MRRNVFTAVKFQLGQYDVSRNSSLDVGTIVSHL